MTLLGVLLTACNKAEKPAQAKPDWVKDEILTQLAELRQDIKSLKGDIANLDSKIGSAAAPPTAARAPERVRLDSPASRLLGDDNAKLTIIEFTDYQCPYCLRHNQAVMPRIKESGFQGHTLFNFNLLDLAWKI